MTQHISWSRVLAEGAIIVVSILLAFGIDAWWDERAARQEARLLLGALEQELAANEEIIAANTAWQEQWADQATVLLEVAASEVPSLPADSLDHLLASLSAWTIPVYERAALDASLAADGLRGIEDASLRPRIAAWGAALDRVVEVESDKASFDRWLTFLHANTYMPQVWNTGLERVEGWQTSRMPGRADADHADLLRSPGFVNLLVERKMVHEDILFFYARLLDTLASLRAEIEAELAL